MPAAATGTSAVCADARRPRRSPRLHASVRPRARCRARRAGLEVELVTSPFRFGARPAADGIPAGRGVLPALEPDRRGTHARVALKALEHPGRDAPAAAPAGRRPPPPVARRARARRRAAPLREAARLHRARPPAAPDGAAARGCGDASSRRFDRIVVHSERGRDALVDFGVRSRSAARDPPPRVPQRAPPRRRRAHGPRAGRDPAVQGAAGRDRGRARRRRRAPARRRRPAHPARGAPRARRRPRRVAARLPRPRRARAGARRGHRRASFPTGTSSTSPARCSRRSVQACQRSSTTSAGSARSSTASPRAASCRPGDVAGLSRRARELLDDPAALAAAREGAARARETLTWDAAAAAHLALYEELA